MTTNPANQKLNLHSLTRLTVQAIAILAVLLLHIFVNPAFALPETEVAANQDCKSELRSLTEKNYAA